MKHRAIGRRPGSPTITFRQDAAERLADVITTLAGLVGLVIALAVPAVFLITQHVRLTDMLDSLTSAYADTVADVAGQSPPAWNAFFGTKSDLSRFITAGADDPHGTALPPVQRRVFARDGRTIMDVPPPQPLAWPVLATRVPVLVDGHQLGEVEIACSLRPKMVTAALLGVVSLAVGVVLVLLLRLLPLRLMYEALERARYLSAHDVLTGLPNRALFNDRLEHSLALARREGTHLALLCLDLDRFKDVNDTLGHAAGDKLLCAVTARMKACLRESDTLARLGGDEFAIIQTGARWPDDAELVARRLAEAMTRPIDIDGHQANVGVSIGIVLGQGDSEGGQLLKDADVALYQAKQGGRERWCFFVPEMNARLLERHALEADLRHAVATNGFTLDYQPQVSLASGWINGAEALLRWVRPGFGPMTPDRFIWLAEEIGLIRAIGGWALREACRTAVSWPGELRVAVNVSPVQFRQADFYDVVAETLTASGLPAGRLELEITEGVLLNDTEETIALLSRLRALGVRLVMDDFGAGYSSLSYLQKFRFDKIKIDRSFIRSLTSDPGALAIVRAVIGMGEAMDVCTNAEGIEEYAQAETLGTGGCTEGQGFLYGRPMPAEDFRRLLDRDDEHQPIIAGTDEAAFRFAWNLNETRARRS